MRIDEQILEDQFRLHVDSRFDAEHKYNVQQFESIKRMLESMHRVETVFDGDKLLDNQDVANMLHIHVRSLARYRKDGRLPYRKVAGRCYYLTSDVRNLLQVCGGEVDGRRKK